MKNVLKIIALSTPFWLGFTNHAIAAEVELDRVAVVVNSGVVLESEIKDFLSNIKSQAEKSGQSLPSDKALRTQVTDKLINDSLLLQQGEKMGVQISDAQLDNTLTNMAGENKLSLEQFRAALVKDGVNYEKYREGVRKELISGEVRRASVRRRVYISPQEVANLLQEMKEKSNLDVEYRLGHILIEFPANPTQEDITSSKTRADKVIELLNSGSDFAKIAIASSGDANALEGGDLGWKNINELPTLFADLVDGQPQDSIFGPIRTGLGFSIVKVLEVRGRQIVEVEEIKARHILIKPSIILSEAKAESMLADFLVQIKAGKADFAELAKEHSEGPTSVRGGDLGWANPETYDPAFKNALATLKVEEYHTPFRSSFGWHLVQLMERRTLDATERMNENRAYQILYNRKFGLEAQRWMKETRDEAHIEIYNDGAE